MTRGEWAQIMQRYAANWPRHPLPDTSAAKFYDDLKHLTAEQATAALEAVFRSGREFPPTSAHLLDEVARQTIDAPPFREAWGLMISAIRAIGAHRPEKVIEWIAQRNPTVADWAARCDIREIGASTEGDTTVYAQHRQHYETVIGRAHRAITHNGIPPAATVVPGLQTRRRAPLPAGNAVARLVDQLEADAAAAAVAKGGPA